MICRKKPKDAVVTPYKACLEPDYRRNLQPSTDFHKGLRAAQAKSALDVYHLLRVPGASLKLNTTKVSANIQVPVFDAHQNPHVDLPTCFIDHEKARELKKAGTHYFGNHSVYGYSGVKAIIELPTNALPEYVKQQREEQEFSGWSVIGQTVRPNRGKVQNGPGFPRWALVH